MRRGRPPQPADYLGRGQDRAAARPEPLWQHPNWFPALLRAWLGPLAEQHQGFVPDHWQPLPADCRCPRPCRQKRSPLAAPKLGPGPKLGQGWALHPNLRRLLPADCLDRRWKRQQLVRPVRARRQVQIRARRHQCFVAGRWPLLPAGCQYPRPCRRPYQPELPEQELAGLGHRQARLRARQCQYAACRWPLRPTGYQYQRPCLGLGPVAALPRVGERALPSLWGLAQRLAHRRLQADCLDRRWKTSFAELRQGLPQERRGSPR